MIKFCWPSKLDSLGIPRPFVGSPDWEAWYGVQNLHNGGRTSLVSCSPICGSLTWCVWDLILSWLCPSYHFSVASLSLDIGHLFLVSFGILLLMVVQQLVAVLVFLKEEMSMHLYPTILNQKPVTFFLKRKSLIKIQVYFFLKFGKNLGSNEPVNTEKFPFTYNLW